MLRPFALISGVIALCWSLGAAAAYQLDMPVGVTETSQQIHHLHQTILIICTIIAVIVFGVLFYSLFKFRHSQGAKAANFHENTVIEVIWTAIPFFILVGMAWPATSTLIDMSDSSGSELTVKITGSQWKWHYQYLDYKGDELDVGFFSLLTTPPEEYENFDSTSEKSENYLLEVDKPLVLPKDTKVRLLVTADDVIHSWWVPDFAAKKDAIPGYINEFWVDVPRLGTYRGQCTELCGKNHGYMPVVVDVVEETDFSQWLQQQNQQLATAEQAAEAALSANLSLQELMLQGEGLYASRCGACHGATGAGTPPVFPALQGSPVALGPIDKHIDMVVNGVAGTAMQAFGKQMTAVELAAVITFERNAWGNNTGDTVQAADIAPYMESN